MSPTIISSMNVHKEQKKRRVPGVSLYVNDFVLDLMTDLADISLNEDKEIMGLLVGNYYEDDNGTYVEVTNIITSDLISSKFHVRFDLQHPDELIDAIDSLNDKESIVGWYHTHLDIGCNMSEIDKKTHYGMFGDEIGFAIIIDPARQELSSFGSSLEPVDMIVLD